MDTKRPTNRIEPQHAPDETLERVARTRVTQEVGDVVIRREPAGLKSATSIWRYALLHSGGRDGIRHFARYDAAAMEGDQEAANRRTRLIYIEDGAALLLMDYREP